MINFSISSLEGGPRRGDYRSIIPLAPFEGGYENEKAPISNYRGFVYY